MNKKIISIIGASGYTGSELLRLLATHPNFEIGTVTASSQAGKSVSELYPHLNLPTPLTFSKTEDCLKELSDSDIVFSALPHGKSMGILPELKAPLIIDLGSDFRLESSEDYIKWYGREHSATTELGKWTYGLPELFKEKISTSSRIANPGCYPTATILSLAPLLENNLITGQIVVSAMSGFSGAGKNASAVTHFPHAFEDTRAYKVTAHQHTPEIEQVLSVAAGKEIQITFTPHLVPMSRGICATCTAPVKSGLTQAELKEIFSASYADCPFVRVAEEAPGTKYVRGSNMAITAPFLDERTGQVVVTTVIDNLVKGAAGQAIQNANIASGLEEITGLPVNGLYP